MADTRSLRQRLFDAVISEMANMVVGQVVIALLLTALAQVWSKPFLYLAAGAVTFVPIPVYLYANRRRTRRSEARVNGLLGKLAAFQHVTPRYVVTGGLYLDVRLEGVDASTLEEAEWTTLEAVRATVGGSAYLVTKSLKRDYGHRARFFTALANDDRDSLTELMRQQLKNDDSFVESDATHFEDCRAPVTVILKQPNRKHPQVTMFTHCGPLKNLNWALVGDDVAEALAERGVLYIGGYFKTSLCDELYVSLLKLQARHLVAVDHGLLPAERESRHKVVRLKAAFRHGLVDIYFCSYQELVQLFEFGRVHSHETWRMRHLHRAARDLHLQLPTLTVVKHDHWIYVLIAGKVMVIRPSDDPRVNVLSASAFNAAFLNHFCTTGLQPGSSLYQHAEHAAKTAVADVTGRAISGAV